MPTNDPFTALGAVDAPVTPPSPQDPFAALDAVDVPPTATTAEPFDALRAAETLLSQPKQDPFTALGAIEPTIPDSGGSLLHTILLKTPEVGIAKRIVNFVGDKLANTRYGPILKFNSEMIDYLQSTQRAPVGKGEKFLTEVAPSFSPLSMTTGMTASKWALSGLAKLAPTLGSKIPLFAETLRSAKIAQVLAADSTKAATVTAAKKAFITNKAAITAGKVAVGFGGYDVGLQLAELVGGADFDPVHAASRVALSSFLGYTGGRLFGKLAGSRQAKSLIREAGAIAEGRLAGAKPSQALEALLEATGIPAAPEIEALAESGLEKARGLAGQVSPKPTFSAKITRQDLVNFAYDQAKSLSDQLIERGVITEAQRGTYLNAHMTQLIQAAGEGQLTALSKQSPMAKFLWSVFGQAPEKANQIDKLHGTQVGRVVHEGIASSLLHPEIHAGIKQTLQPVADALKKTGLSQDVISLIAQYFEKGVDGVIKFNPAARAIETPFVKHIDGPVATLLNRPDYSHFQLPPLTPEQEALFVQFRQAWDSIVDQAPEFGAKLGHIPGYMMILPREITKRTKGGGILQKVVDTSITKHRSSGFLDPAKHETNIDILIDAYSRAASSHFSYKKMMNLGIHEINKLNMLGDHDAAKSVAKYMVDTLGLRDIQDLSKAVSDEVFAVNSNWLREIAKKAHDPNKFWSQAYTAWRDVIYHRYIGMSPKTILQQLPQSEFMTAAETGPTYVARARALQARGYKGYTDILDKVLPMLRTKDPTVLSEATAQPIQHKGIKAVRWVLTLPGRPGMWLYDKGDIAARKVSFLAGYLQAQDSLRRGGLSGFDTITDSLLESQRATLRTIYQETLRKNGAQAAQEAIAQMYGVVRSIRSNFAYGTTEAPELFRGELGRWFPFRTWSLAQVNRVVGDIQEGNVSALVKRGVIPMLYIGLLRGAFGWDIPGSHPLSALSGVGRLTLGGPLADVAKAAVQGGPPAVVQKVSDIMLPFQQIGRILRGQTGIYKVGPTFGERISGRRIKREKNR